MGGNEFSNGGYAIDAVVAGSFAAAVTAVVTVAVTIERLKLCGVDTRFFTGMFVVVRAVVAFVNFSVRPLQLMRLPATFEKVLGKEPD